MASARPSLRFFHAAALRTRTNKVLAAIERLEDPTPHADAFSALVTSLTEAGLDYYFLKAVRDAKLGFVARQTAEMGVAGATRVISPILRSVIRSADAAQLKTMAKHLRQLMG